MYEFGWFALGFGVAVFTIFFVIKKAVDQDSGSVRAIRRTTTRDESILRPAHHE